MKGVVALGSNLGDRRRNLEEAARYLRAQMQVRILRTSPVFSTAALVPVGAPKDWKKPFLNAVMEVEWPGSPLELLSCLKATERQLGRTEAPRWSPRVIDLDLILLGDHTSRTPELTLPHSEFWNRQFVLTPLKHLWPGFVLQGQPQSVLSRSRELTEVTKEALPLWMAILNLTPDSFSDGGQLWLNEEPSQSELEERLRLFDEHGIHVLDVGAESTRPQAQALSSHEEWRRLESGLGLICEKYKDRCFPPWISVDTYHSETAARALESGAHIINDVSGLAQESMLEVLQGSSCQYILMHSLSVPADPKLHIDSEDPVSVVKAWAQSRLERLEAAGVGLERVLFDPGIGFGKTAIQSLALLQRIHEFQDLPVRLVVGHSRKSFMNLWGPRCADDREWESVAVSLRLAERGVDVLRVHRADLHTRAYRAFQDVSP
ncbi:MAG: dihydropteroate synthase [Bdellovibrionales bacterium]